MKKLLALALVSAMTMSLFACGNTDELDENLIDEHLEDRLENGEHPEGGPSDLGLDGEEGERPVAPHDEDGELPEGETPVERVPEPEAPKEEKPVEQTTPPTQTGGTETPPPTTPPAGNEEAPVPPTAPEETPEVPEVEGNTSSNQSEALFNKVMNALTVDEVAPMMGLDEDMFVDFYNVADTSIYASFSANLPMMSAVLSEVTIVEATDGNVSNVQSLLLARAQTVINNNVSGYPSHTEMAPNYKLIVKGNFVIYIVGEMAEEIATALNSVA